MVYGLQRVFLGLGGRFSGLGLREQHYRFLGSISGVFGCYQAAHPSSLGFLDVSIGCMIRG